MIDDLGRAVTLRGVSLFWSQWKPEFFNRKLVSWLTRDWRINVIRLPVAATSPGYLTDPSRELAKATEVIDAAIACGIYAVVDWHGHEPHTEQALGFFEAVATRYPDSPNVLFELWNEPNSSLEWQSDIVPHHRALLAAIRQISPTAPIILGTPHFCTNLEDPALYPLDEENIAYALHFYAGTHRAGLRRRADAAIAAGLTLFASEWGLSEAAGCGVLDPVEGLRWTDFLNQRGISHIGWSICDKNEASAALRVGASPAGAWPRSDLSKSGRWMRDYLRRSWAAEAATG
jgi:endoglucanase